MDNAVVRIMMENGKPELPIWFKSGNPLRRVKTVVYQAGLYPDQYQSRELLPGIRFIDLIYKDEVEYRYDKKCFGILEVALKKPNKK